MLSLQSVITHVQMNGYIEDFKNERKDREKEHERFLKAEEQVKDLQEIVKVLQ